MVQDQLVEYISTQLKAGVSAETLRTTLVGAGWQAVDVDDTMKKVQPAQPIQQAQPVQMQAQLPKEPTSFSVGSFSTAQKTEPQVIRVSDLVSSTGAAKPAVQVIQTTQTTTRTQTAQPMQVSSAKTDAVMARIANGAAGMQSSSSSAMSGMGVSSGVKKSHALATETVLGVLMVLFGAAAIFFFFENRSLSGQFTSLNATSGGVTSQLSVLQAELDASTTALSAQVSSAIAASDALALEMSFLVVPPGSAATTTFTTALAGTVSGGGKFSYVVTTAHGAKVYVTNSKDARLITLLQPLIGTATVQLAGNYVPGSDAITISAVNGTSVVPPPVAATSTATSTGATTTTP